MTSWAYRFFVMLVIFFAVLLAALLILLAVVGIVNRAKRNREARAKASRLSEMSYERENKE